MGQVQQAYLRDEGSFYLCGPTWPVPDVTQVLQEAYEIEEKSKRAKKVDSRRAIEELKDAGRYVLEVY
jgi:sulfite reductase (NADPH) flavoprotein alpha-component